MHTSVQVTDNVYWVGVNDWETCLFEAYWPLPYGISYNSYLILDDKVALIDAVKGLSFDVYLEKLRQVLPAGKGIDYLVINHMEPDHSGAIARLKELYPDMTLIGNKQTKRFLHEFFGLEQDVQTIADGDTLELGRHTLQFNMTPMVHWPETMMTYETSGKILFSGDAFGTFGALAGGVFDDELAVDKYDDEILRYFANIVGKYSRMVQRALKKLSELEINVVASTHGPVWRRDTAAIINRYDKWSRHNTETGVTIVYGSMYGNTTRMMEALAKGLKESGINNVPVHDVSTSHPSYVLRDVWRYKGVVFGAPAYDQGLFPPMRQVIGLLQEKGLTKRIAGVFGSYGWSGGAVKALREFVEKADWELVEPIVETNCSPFAEDLDKCRELGNELAGRVIS
ncbi:MAG: FprA family A-type flavoprotein [Verrucomicrobiota bacterium]